MRHAERHLLRFGEEVVGIPVQHQPTDRNDHELFGDDLGGVEDVEGEALGLFFGEDLKPSSHSG